MKSRLLLSITFAFAALSTGFSPHKTLLAEATITAVMSGLDSPRGLAFGPERAPGDAANVKVTRTAPDVWLKSLTRRHGWQKVSPVTWYSTSSGQSTSVV
jgi:hypothetical protein